MKIFLLILLLLLLRLLCDIKEKLSGPTKSWITKEFSNCNDIDQENNPNSDNYNLGDGIKVSTCNLVNTFKSIGYIFSNSFKALGNTVGLGKDIITFA